MRTYTLTVLAALAILLLAVGAVTAHDGDTTDHDDASVNESAADWAVWMEQHMTEHMGVDAAAQMQERMGMNFEEMGEHMSAHHDGSMMADMMNSDMSSMGCH